jgi:tyrosine-protein kinase Etk/Wzc
MTSHDDLVKTTFRLLTYYRGRIWWITTRVFVLTVAITALGLVFVPKYVATTRLTLMPTRSEIGFAASHPEMWGMSPVAMLCQTHEETLMSRTLALDVARTLRADSSAELNNGGWAGHVRRSVIAPVKGFFRHVVSLLNTGRWETPDPLLSMAKRIQARTNVKNVSGSFVFEVSVNWENPKIAAKVANVMTERYVHMVVQTGQEEMRSTREYIEERIKETSGALAALDARIKDYRTSEKIYATSTDMDLGRQELSLYERDLNATRVNREQLDARINALKAYKTPAEMASVEADRVALKTRQEAVEKVIDEQTAQLDKLPAKEAGLLDLYRDRKIKERTLAEMEDRLMEAKVAEASQLSVARVIDPAIPPDYPTGPLMLLNGVVSIFVGLLLALGSVLLSEARRAGLRSREDLDSDESNMIGVIPSLAVSGSGGAKGPGKRSPEGVFRTITYGHRDHLQTIEQHVAHLFARLTDGDSTRACLFVSLNGGEGKTFLIEQLAKVASGGGRKVLLVDGNLHKPTLHVTCDKPLTPGLKEMLSGAATARDAVVHVNDNLDLICAGVMNMSGQAKWRIDAVRQEFASLAAQYDLILIDSAALRSDTVTMRLLPLATEVVAVFNAMISRRSDLHEMRRLLQGAAGRMRIVLNRVLHRADHLFATGTNGSKPKVTEPGAQPQDGRKKVNRGYGAGV